MEVKTVALMPALYSRIQLIPDLDRDEAINLGVALYCQEADYFDVLYLSEDDAVSTSRLRRFAPDVDVEDVRGDLAAIRNYLASMSHLGMQELHDAREQFGPRLVMREFQPLMSRDPAKDLDHLYRQLTVAPPVQARPRGPRVSTKLKSILISRRLIANFEPRTVEVHRFPVNLDFVEREYARTVFKTFRLQKDIKSFDIATKWNYTFQALRDTAGYKEASLVAVCELDGSQDAQEAADILSENTGVKVVNVQEEDRILQYAQVGR